MLRTKDTPPLSAFRSRVLSVVAQIECGEVLTYKQVAERAGNPRAARAVGAVLRTNYDPNIPCHRVVKSDGSLGGYNRGRAQKQRLLEREAREAHNTKRRV